MTQTTVGLLLFIPIGLLLFIRWLTRRPVLDERIEMTNARRAEIIQYERGERR